MDWGKKAGKQNSLNFHYLRGGLEGKKRMGGTGGKLSLCSSEVKTLGNLLRARKESKEDRREDNNSILSRKKIW